jgi:hypothetical protein
MKNVDENFDRFETRVNINREDRKIKQKMCCKEKRFKLVNKHPNNDKQFYNNNLNQIKK